MPIQQPNTQIKLTNVSLVRMKKGKKRFEIACYQNKVQDWRSNLEKNLDDVLQINQVFTNVSKGQVAPVDDLKKAFGTTDIDKIVLEILSKGEIQLNEKERQAKTAQVNNEIVSIIAGKCINPKTKRPYPPSMISKALAEIKFNVSSTKAAKIQALEAIKLLVSSQVIPIARAKMKIRITSESKDSKSFSSLVKPLLEEIEEDSWTGSSWECVAFIDPGKYKDINELAQANSKARASVEVLSMAVAEEGNKAL